MEVPYISKIRDNLYLGSAEGLIYLKYTPVTAILNVATEVPLAKGLKAFKVSMRDEPSDAHKKTGEAVEILNKLLDAGETVFVHCRHGRSRSPHVVAECLSERETRDYFEVYKELKELRPEVMSYSMGQEIVDRWRAGRLK